MAVQCVVAFPALTSCFMIKWGRESRQEDEEGEEHDLEPLPTFTEVHISFETVKSFLFMCAALMSMRDRTF